MSCVVRHLAQRLQFFVDETPAAALRALRFTISGLLPPLDPCTMGVSSIDKDQKNGARRSAKQSIS